METECSVVIVSETSRGRCAKKVAGFIANGKYPVCTDHLDRYNDDVSKRNHKEGQ